MTEREYSTPEQCDTISEAVKLHRDLPMTKALRRDLRIRQNITQEQLNCGDPHKPGMIGFLQGYLAGLKEFASWWDDVDAAARDAKKGLEEGTPGTGDGDTVADLAAADGRELSIEERLRL